MRGQSWLVDLRHGFDAVFTAWHSAQPLLIRATIACSGDELVDKAHR